jgi:hypothetical protein
VFSCRGRRVLKGARNIIRLDDDVLEWFRRQVYEAAGNNFQSLIDAALREYIEQRREPLEETCGGLCVRNQGEARSHRSRARA